jgi:Polyketide cyclase / dehydrase and lipid transport
MFSLDDRPLEWVTSAPVRISREIDLSASPTAVFEVLADHDGWPSWFAGMTRTRVDGASSGMGALRTVWLGVSRVQERFLVWDPGRRFSFAIVKSNLPGMRAMVEDWKLAPAGPGSRLSIDIGIQPAGPLRLAPGVLRAVVSRMTRGASGLTEKFG